MSIAEKMIEELNITAPGLKEIVLTAIKTEADINTFFDQFYKENDLPLSICKFKDYKLQQNLIPFKQFTIEYAFNPLNALETLFVQKLPVDLVKIIDTLEIPLQTIYDYRKAKPGMSLILLLKKYYK